MFKGFKDFLLRGNVIDLSVAVVIGAAFTDVVTAVTNSFLKPLIQLLSPGVGEFAGKVRVDGVAFDYATVINQTITFVITAGVVYFLVVAPMKAIQTRRLRGEESGSAQPTDVELLVQIRDLLEDQASSVVDADSTRPVLSPMYRLAAAAPAPIRPWTAADPGPGRRPPAPSPQVGSPSRASAASSISTTIVDRDHRIPRYT